MSGNAYITRLTPVFKDYLWGGNRLAAEYGKSGASGIIAESWELSTHQNGRSMVADGILAGHTFKEYLDLFPGALGTNSACGDGLPVLFKLIDAREPLSIQVHPDDSYAVKNEGQHGKTEMWYVLDAQSGAYIYYGFSHPTSRAQALAAIEDGSITDHLKKVPVSRGDAFFIPPGTVHAIGEGIIIAEVQQNSDVTYRVYDFMRRGPDGNLRELHIRKALDVAVLDVAPAGNDLKSVPVAGGMSRTLAKCEYFTAQELSLGAAVDIEVGQESFLALFCARGGCIISGENSGASLTKGETAFVPAGFGAVRLEGSALLLLIKI